jgi:flagellar biosynthesis/type III secretory pathway protein FliH
MTARPEVRWAVDEALNRLKSFGPITRDSGPRPIKQVAAEISERVIARRATNSSTSMAAQVTTVLKSEEEDCQIDFICEPANGKSKTTRLAYYFAAPSCRVARDA